MALFNVTSTSIATRNVANAEPMKPPRPAHILSSLINSVFSIFFLHFYFIFIFIFFICTAWFAYTLSWRNRRHIEGMKRSSSMLNMHPAYRIGRAYQSGLDYVHRDNKSYSCYGKNQKKNTHSDQWVHLLQRLPSHRKSVPGATVSNYNYGWLPS